MINRKLSSKIITGLFAVMVGVAGVQGVTAYASSLVLKMAAQMKLKQEQRRMIAMCISNQHLVMEKM